MKLTGLPRIAVAMGLSLLVASSAAALSLAEALAAANQRSPQAHAVQEAVNAADSQARLARAELLPTLNLVAGYHKLNGDVYFNRFFPVSPGQPTPPPAADLGPYNSSQAAALQLDQVLYAGGAHRAGIDAAKLGHDIALQEAAQQHRELSYEVTLAYFSAVLAGKAMAVAEKNIERSHAHLTTIQRLFDEQEALHAEVLGAQAQLAMDEQARQQAATDLRVATLTLNRLLGNALDTPLELSDDLDQPQQTPDRQGSRAKALQDNPSLTKRRLQGELAETQLHGAKAYRKPKLKLQAMASRVDDEMVFKGSTYGVGLTLSIPFLKDFTAGGGAVAHAQAQRAIEQHSLEEETAALSIMVEQAVGQLEQAYGAIRAAQAGLAFHKERYRVTEQAFGEQLSTFSDLLEEHAALSEAELGVYQSMFAARKAEAELQRLTGQ